MIHIRSEGESIRTGFNFYPLKCHNVGFVFRLFGFILTARYNKLHGKFRFGARKV